MKIKNIINNLQGSGRRKIQRFLFAIFQGEDILVDNLGFTYNCYRLSKDHNIRYWCCSVRSKDSVCSAKVTQQNEHVFARSRVGHVHEARLNNAVMLKARMLVKAAAQRDVHKPSITVVKSVVHELLKKCTDVDESSINWENLRRIANRTRQKHKVNIHSYCVPT